MTELPSSAMPVYCIYIKFKHHSYKLKIATLTVFGTVRKGGLYIAMQIHIHSCSTYIHTCILACKDQVKSVVLSSDSVEDVTCKCVHVRMYIHAIGTYIYIRIYTYVCTYVRTCVPASGTCLIIRSGHSMGFHTGFSGGGACASKKLWASEPLRIFF